MQTENLPRASIAEFCKRQATSTLPKSKYFYKPTHDVYLRAGNYAVGGKVAKCITIAKIDVHPEHRSTGVFRAVVDYISKIASDFNYEMVVVECVHNDILKDYLPRTGFTLFDENNYFREVKKVAVENPTPWRILGHGEDMFHGKGDYVRPAEDDCIIDANGNEVVGCSEWMRGAENFEYIIACVNKFEGASLEHVNKSTIVYDYRTLEDEALTVAVQVEEE